MDDNGPRGPEEQGKVPQGPGGAAKERNRGEHRRRRDSIACSVLGERGIALGIENSFNFDIVYTIGNLEQCVGVPVLQNYDDLLPCLLWECLCALYSPVVCWWR